MSGRDAESIKRWKESEVIFIVSHGQISSAEAPKVPKPNMLVLQTGEIAHSVKVKALPELYKLFQGGQKAKTYDAIFGTTALDTLPQAFKQAFELFHVAVGPDEPTLAKIHSYDPKKDLSLGVGIFRLEEDGPKPITIGPIQTWLERPGGVTTAEILNELSQRLNRFTKTTIVLVSCSSVKSGAVHASTMAAGESMRAQTGFFSTKSSSEGLTGASKEKTQPPAAIRRAIAAGSKKTGPEFHPSAFNDTEPEANPHQRLKEATFDIVGGEVRPVRSVPKTLYTLIIQRENGRLEDFNYKGHLYQFDNSVDMLELLKQDQDFLRSEGRKILAQSPKGWLAVRTISRAGTKYQTISDFKREMEKSWAPLCSRISCGFLKWGGKRSRRRRHTQKRRRLNAKTRRNK